MLISVVKIINKLPKIDSLFETILIHGEYFFVRSLFAIFLAAFTSLTEVHTSIGLSLIIIERCFNPIHSYF